MKTTNKLTMSITLLMMLLMCVPPAWADDFYQLLAVDKQASAKEIRKAFKKMALEMHPDKRMDDPDAHDKFLKINRAYEVLKDDDLRKKYDLYGEEGLKEGGPSGRGYKSWNFYNSDFGIYDDDPEIITLNKMDFEESVKNTDDVWFINFYSPQCSHCHDLAPTWRELARELEGVIRIGAVNCGDEWMLCRQQGIRSYPSLLMFPQKEKYQGDRSTRELVKYALRQVKAPVVELWSGNFESEIEDDEKMHLPWLISFCGDGGDCLEHSSTLKLAAALVDLVNVAMVDCHSTETICDKLSIESGTYYFEAQNVTKENRLVIDSLDPKEIIVAVLSQLPDVQMIDKESFIKIQDQLEITEPWLIHFVEGEVFDVELRKLRVIIEDIQVGRVDCSLMRTECNSLHIHKFPTFVVFKQGGGHEIFHGRQTARDIAAFARDSAVTPLQVLGPKDFPERVIEKMEPWFVDFYAPWCPPCMKLLPEFRKTSREMGDKIHFGTVDCTVHQGLCNNYKIHSYPTTILYNQSVAHEYHGHHNVKSMMEFIEDTLKPPVENLDPKSFQEKVGHKEINEIWLVDFFSPNCGPCQQLAPEWRKLAKMVANIPDIKVAQVDCQAHRSLCSEQNIRGYPSIRLYPSKSNNAQLYHTYNGWYRDAPSIRAWAFEYLPSSVEVLTSSKFKEIITSSQPWVVDFYAPWCGHCQVFAPEFERVAQSLEGVVNAGKVDCDVQKWLCQKAGIRAYPTLRFYAGTSNSRNAQNYFGEDINSFDSNYLISLLRSKVSEKNKLPQKDEL